MPSSNEQQPRGQQRSTNTMNAELILRAMLQQEESCYKIDDYFQKLPLQSSQGLLPVDADARQQIAQWCMNIMGAFGFSKETAAVTMSCLDRFVSTSNGSEILLDRCHYQLAALTALYFSVKIHCPTALSPEFVAKLSQGAYVKEDVEAMERRMLDAIQWRVNPPTAMDFVRIHLDMISSSQNIFDQHTHNVIMELVGYQTNLSVLQFEIATNRASYVAVASLLNAIESIYPNDKELYETIHNFTSLSTDIDPQSLESLQRQLFKSITEQNGVKFEAHEKSTCESPVNKRLHRDSFAESPRSVYEHSSTLVQ